MKVELCLLTCSCSSPCCEVDVGVGYITCGSQHCEVHGFYISCGKTGAKNYRKENK